MSPGRDKFDIAVIGAGPAGSIAAYRLAQADYRVVLIDKPLSTRRKIGESLPAAACPLLRRLGLHSILESGPHRRSFGNGFAWGSPELETTDFIRDPNGLGWQLDRVRFDKDLRAAALSVGAVAQNALLRQVEPTPTGWRLGLEASEIEARFVIDASGRQGAFVRKIGLHAEPDSDLMAAYRWVKPRRGDRDSRTLIEAAPQGWWYSARLSDGSRVVAFHGLTDTAKAMVHDEELWDRSTADTLHLSPLIVGTRPLTAVRAALASGSALVLPCGTRWIAAGDVAMAFDPISSQGIFNAIYSGMAAADAVQENFAGAHGSLETYAARLSKIRNAYLLHRLSTYHSEARWSDLPFWREQQRSALGPRLVPPQISVLPLL